MSIQLAQNTSEALTFQDVAEWVAKVEPSPNDVMHMAELASLANNPELSAAVAQVANLLLINGHSGPVTAEAISRVAERFGDLTYTRPAERGQGTSTDDILATSRMPLSTDELREQERQAMAEQRQNFVDAMQQQFGDVYSAEELLAAYAESPGAPYVPLVESELTRIRDALNDNNVQLPDRQDVTVTLNDGSSFKFFDGNNGVTYEVNRTIVTYDYSHETVRVTVGDEVGSAEAGFLLLHRLSEAIQTQGVRSVDAGTQYR